MLECKLFQSIKPEVIFSSGRETIREQSSQKVGGAQTVRVKRENALENESMEIWSNACVVS